MMMIMMKITQIIERNLNQIAFYFVEEGPGRGSEDIKKECNVNCFDFFSFSVYFMDVIGGKITITLTHCGRVTQICVFNTVKLGTSASSP